MKKKSWEEEHEEFLKREAHKKVGPKWILGFYQVVPSDEPPETGLQDNSLEGFLLPEQKLSLKLYFDNLRNYAICAALIALAEWVSSSHVQKLGLQVPGWLFSATAIAIWSFAGVLLILNCAQTWLLARELDYALRVIKISRTYIYRNIAPSHFTLLVLHIIGLIVMDTIGRLVAMTLSAAVILISIGFVAFTVLSKQMAG